MVSFCLWSPLSNITILEPPMVFTAEANSSMACECGGERLRTERAQFTVSSCCRGNFSAKELGGGNTARTAIISAQSELLIVLAKLVALARKSILADLFLLYSS